MAIAMVLKAIHQVTQICGQETMGSGNRSKQQILRSAQDDKLKG
jgi:hypothetical protein